MSVRTTISLPDELKARMDALNEPVNWSAEAAKCFEKLLGEIASRKQEKDLSDIIARLRATKMESEEKASKIAHDAGVYWATHHATYQELERAVNYDRSVIGDCQWNGPYRGCDWIAFILLGVEDDEDRLSFELSDEFWQLAGIKGGADAVDEMGDGFLYDFFEGAEEIWDKVADKI